MTSLLMETISTTLWCFWIHLTLDPEKTIGFSIPVVTLVFIARILQKEHRKSFIKTLKQNSIQILLALYKSQWTFAQADFFLFSSITARKIQLWCLFPMRSVSIPSPLVTWMWMRTPSYSSRYLTLFYQKCFKFYLEQKARKEKENLR